MDDLENGHILNWIKICPIAKRKGSVIIHTFMKLTATTLTINPTYKQSEVKSLYSEHSSDKEDFERPIREL